MFLPFFIWKLIQLLINIISWPGENLEKNVVFHNFCTQKPEFSSSRPAERKSLNFFHKCDALPSDISVQQLGVILKCHGQ